MRYGVSVWVWVGLLGAGLLGCSGSHSSESNNTGGTGATDGGVGGSGGGAGFVFDGGGGSNACPCDDFPATPILETGGATQVPSNAPDLFGAPGSGTNVGGPCIVEPSDDALFPKNWLRPRFRWIAGANQNLFELSVHASSEENDLRVYTSSSSWTMPMAMWSALASHAIDEPITVSVRGAGYDGQKFVGTPAISNAVTWRVAPARAAGTIVYWTTSNGTALKGFKVGDESVVDVLMTWQANAPCIGCHTSTPDGKFVSYSGTSTSSAGADARIGFRSGDGSAAIPSFVSSAAQNLLNRTSQAYPAFSQSHWKDGDRTLLSMLIAPDTLQSAEIAWTDLETSSESEGTGWGVIARKGDAKDPMGVAFSHDGTRVAYSSADIYGPNVEDHADLYAVPYNNRLGGDALPIKGANDAAYNEFYPVFSPDDKLIAYTRTPSGEGSYNNPVSEVFVVPSDGGTAARFLANDPPSCTNKKSPGVTNSWPKWSPESTTVGAKTYYWVIFSSTRSENELPQLYITSVVAEGGALTTHSALYLWNQPREEGNHTPAWDVFEIPPVPR